MLRLTLSVHTGPEGLGLKVAQANAEVGRVGDSERGKRQVSMRHSGFKDRKKYDSRNRLRRKIEGTREGRQDVSKQLQHKELAEGATHQVELCSQC